MFLPWHAVFVRKLLFLEDLECIINALSEELSCLAEQEAQDNLGTSFQLCSKQDSGHFGLCVCVCVRKREVELTLCCGVVQGWFLFWVFTFTRARSG